MHAVSEDLKHWTKTQDAVTFVPQPGYDPDDWRDPFVLWDDESEKYILILGARHSGISLMKQVKSIPLSKRHTIAKPGLWMLIVNFHAFPSLSYLLFYSLSVTDPEKLFAERNEECSEEGRKRSGNAGIEEGKGRC